MYKMCNITLESTTALILPFCSKQKQRAQSVCKQQTHNNQLIYFFLLCLQTSMYFRKQQKNKSKCWVISQEHTGRLMYSDLGSYFRTVVFLGRFWKGVQSGGVEYSSTKVLQRAYHKHNSVQQMRSLCTTPTAKQKRRSCAREQSSSNHKEPYASHIAMSSL